MLICNAVWAVNINRRVNRKLWWHYFGRHYQSKRGWNWILICNAVWASIISQSHEIFVIISWSPLSVKECKEKRHVTQRGPPLAVHVQTDNWQTRKENLVLEMNNLNVMGRKVKIFSGIKTKKILRDLTKYFLHYRLEFLSFCIKINTWWRSTSLECAVFENVIINKGCVRRNMKFYVM